MKLYVPIEDLRSAINLTDIISDGKFDRELISYCYAAQEFAENYCSVKFDGSVERVEYLSGSDPLDEIVFPSRPLVSVTSVYDDLDRNFESDSLVASSDYFLNKPLGVLTLKNTQFNEGDRNLKCTFKAGYLPEKDVVETASVASSHTIVNIDSSGQAFTVFLNAVGNTANKVCTITGTTDDGATVTETIKFTEAGQRRISRYHWTSITAVNSSDLTTGTIRVSATSFPSALRTAIILHVQHLYHQDNDKTINVTSRQLGQKSESGLVKEVPKEVLQILDGYRRWI